MYNRHDHFNDYLGIYKLIKIFFACIFLILYYFTL